MEGKEFKQNGSWLSIRTTSGAPAKAPVFGPQGLLSMCGFARHQEVKVLDDLPLTRSLPVFSSSTQALSSVLSVLSLKILAQKEDFLKIPGWSHQSHLQLLGFYPSGLACWSEKIRDRHCLRSQDQYQSLKTHILS